MAEVVVDITMSLDGYVAGPHDGLEGGGLGENGEVLHYWVFGAPWTYDSQREMRPVGVDKVALESAIASGGASVVGRRMYDVTGGWGGTSPFNMPTVVVTHRTDNAPDPSSGFVFVDGIEAAIDKALELADGKDVAIGGGADVIQQAFTSGRVDRLNLHVAPVILGAGRPLFGQLDTRVQLEPVGDVTQSPYATHLRYRVKR